MEFPERIKNGKLLIAAGEGKLEEVESLIDKEADVNFSDVEGYTVLHYAVESKNLKVVQQVINEVENVSIENNENKTPLNIAREIGKQDIIEAIEEKILENSFEMLNYLKNVIPPNAVNEKNSQKEEIREKIKKKIEVSLQALTDLTNNENDIKKFTYKNVNVFLLFLEAFALQDKEIKEEQKDEFINCFGQKNYELIGSLRIHFVHQEDTNKDSNTIIEPLYLQKFIKNLKSSEVIKNVFMNLKNYMEEIFKKLSEKQNISDIKDLTEILLVPQVTKSKSKPRTQEKMKKNAKIFELFRKIVKVAYSNDVKQEELEEVMFNLIVNIFPCFFKTGVPENLQELKDLRNELLHNFHKYKNLNRTLELKKSISNIRSNLFKYYYSEKVYDLLQSLPCYVHSESIIKKLNEVSRDVADEFGLLYLSVSIEEGRSFEYIFKKSLFPEKDEDIQVLIEQYFKFMIIIDSRKEEEVNQFVDENEGTKTSEQYRELSDLQKREIFEDFVKLKQISQNFDEEYKKEKQKEFKEKLGEYGIIENYFNKVSDNNLNNETQSQVEMVKNIIYLLRNILKEQKKLTIKDVIDLYKASILFSSNYESIFRRAALAQNEIWRIKNILVGLPKYNEIVNISIATKNIQINIPETVINILKMFYNSYNKYQIKFDNLKEAFSDKTFLKYLVIRDTEVDSGQGSQQKVKFKDKNYVFKIIKKLIQIEYTAPYIASLIIKVQSNEVIERDDLKKLIEILLEKDTYIIYLAELLSIENTVHNLYEEVCNKMLEKKDINVESMDIIFKESKSVKGILAVLKERIASDEVVKLTKKVLESVNNTILYWYYHRDCEKAKKIASLEEIRLTYKVLKDKNLVENDNPIVVWYKLNLAKVINFLGLEAERQKEVKEATEFYNKALELLEEVPHSIDIRQFLLVLCRKAYTKFLLKKYTESYQEYEELLKRIVNFALDPIHIPSSEKEIYAKIKNSQRYIDLLALSSEHKKYLDILDIRIIMGDAKMENKDYEEACKIYKQVYDRQKDFRMDDISISRTMVKIARINSLIAKEQWKKDDYQTVLQYNYDSLVEEIRVFEIRRDKYSNLHPLIKTSSVKSTTILYYIACTNKRLGDHCSKQQNDRKKKYYNEALKIYENLNEFQKIILDEEHKYTPNILKNIKERIHNLKKKFPMESILQPIMKRRYVNKKFSMESISQPTLKRRRLLQS